jgi:hypothetical protein
VTARAVLRPGDRVRYDGADYLVVALAGTSVRLRSDDGTELVVLAGHLMACPEFTVIGGGPLPEVEPSGLLEGLPPSVLEKAREWERHVVEVLTGCRRTRRRGRCRGRPLTRPPRRWRSGIGPRRRS